jgi:flagellar motor switch protein FliG
MINALKFEGDSWVYAKEVPEFTPFDLNLLIPSMLILSLDNRAAQKVLREVDEWDLKIALKGASDAVLDKVFQNITKRRGIMLKEDMEYIGPIGLQDIEKSRNKIFSVIRHLEDTGEIVFPH